MYQVVIKDGLFWIAHDNEILEELGSFIEPVSPQIIVKEIKNEEVQI